MNKWKSPLPLTPLKNALTQYVTYFGVHKVLKGFQPKVRIDITKNHYRVKTAESWDELRQVLKLRHEVFHEEFLGRRLPLGIDMDKYDPIGDHLIIIDNETRQMVGTYRLICSKFSQTFYSASEFQVDSFLLEPGVKLELSRACVHKDYRTGVIMHLLWRGLTQYIQSVQADYLFGCASIRTTAMADVLATGAFLKSQNAFLGDRSPRTLKAYTLPGLAEEWSRMGIPSAEQIEYGKAFIPPLLASYMKAGARVGEYPALDRAFECIDYFTLLRIKDLNPLFERRYMGQGSRT